MSVLGRFVVPVPLGRLVLRAVLSRFAGSLVEVVGAPRVADRSESGVLVCEVSDRAALSGDREVVSKCWCSRRSKNDLRPIWWTDS